MKRVLLIFMFLVSAPPIIAQTETGEEKHDFESARVLSVTDIPARSNCVGNGTVVLEALITASGEIQKIEVRRDIACLTQLAVQAVKDWKFSPATVAGEAITSRIPVAVTFRPPAPYADPVPLPELIPQNETAIQAEFQPAEVVHAEFPKYTATTFASGAVVLELGLSEKGEAGDTKVLRDLPPFTDEAKAVVGKWRFMTATFNGRPVSSRIVLAFVSPPPVSPY